MTNKFFNMAYKIIDLSHWNNVIDWNKVANDCDGVILKCGGSDSKNGVPYQDKMFQHYYECAKAVRLPVGAYFFSKGMGTDKGINDAVACYMIIRDCELDLPIYCDYEVGAKCTKDSNTDYVKAFCTMLERYGYFVGIYASDISGFKEQLNKDELTRWSWWVARYGKKPQYAIDKDNFKMWQKSSTGKINGINGNVDISECYTDFTSIIRKAHKNGF